MDGGVDVTSNLLLNCEQEEGPWSLHLTSELSVSPVIDAGASFSRSFSKSHPT